MHLDRLERPREMLERLCLTTLRDRGGELASLRSVCVEKLSDDPRSLNWDVASFDPPLKTADAISGAGKVVAQMRGTYQLAS